MQAANVVDAWIGFVAAASVAWLVWVAWPRLLVDHIRQGLFELRDELFDRAVRGELEFESASYHAARNVLNSMIRNAEDATVWRYARYAVLMKSQEGHQLVERFQELLTGPKTPESIRVAYARALGLYDQLLIGRSPVLWLMSGVVRAAAKLLNGIARPVQPTYWRVASYLRRNRVAALSADLSADLDCFEAAYVC